MARGLGRSTLTLIEASTEILKVEQPTTVRAVAYRLFTRGLIPNMGKNATNKVSRVLTQARERGYIPWEWIVDETREAESARLWKDTDEIIQAAVKGYRRDLWQDQPEWIEVWSEKGTVRGILQPVLDKYGVTFRVMHGFTSATAAMEVAQTTQAREQLLIAAYIGDYDPSGLFMSQKDLPHRFWKYGGSVNIRRIALTEDDVHRGDLPHFDASTKKGDPRYSWYACNYGNRAWELDAMPSNLLRDRVEEWIVGKIDTAKWEHAMMIEKAETRSMQAFHNAWKEAQR